MSNNGKHVRAPIDVVDSETELDRSWPEAFYHDNLESTELGANETAATDSESNPDLMETAPGEGEEESEEPNTEVAKDQNGFYERLNKMEKMLTDIVSAMDRGTVKANAVDTTERSVPDLVDGAEHGWGYSSGGGTQKPLENQLGIRWETPSFPRNVPANKLWEAWHRFLENFEISASLSNANDPTRRAQMLFLSMGEDLQGIVRAAKLRPDLRNPQCYSMMVKSIDTHLRSMTDTAAEHEAFMNMRQGKDESAVAFHARLQEKVRLCGYSPNDQERFVRAQLLKGLSNRELAKASRTFAHDTIYIVQSATREEAYVAENATSSGLNALAVSQQHKVSGGKLRRRQIGKQDTGIRQRQTPYTNKPGQGRRFRCSKCNRMRHTGEPCPALNRKCNACGILGHFAVTCHNKRVSIIQEKQKKRDPTGWTDDENNNDQV